MKFNVTIGRDKFMSSTPESQEYEVEIRPLFPHESDSPYTFMVKVYYYDDLGNKQEYCDTARYYEFAENAEATTNSPGGFIKSSNFEMNISDYRYFKYNLSKVNTCRFDTSWESINESFQSVVKDYLEKPFDCQTTSEYLMSIYNTYVDELFGLVDYVGYYEI